MRRNSCPTMVPDYVPTDHLSQFIVALVRESSGLIRTLRQLHGAGTVATDISSWRMMTLLLLNG